MSAPPGTQGVGDKEATVNTSMMGWLRPLLWAVAIALFIIGGYSDTNTTECWAWAFALLTAGLLVGHLPGRKAG
jgi:hypothetical protein